MNGLYFPSEHALLCSWFGMPCPDAYRDIDLYSPPERAEGIWPERRKYADDDHALANAVARVVLGAIQQRLPQVGIFDKEGDLMLGRGYYPKPDRPVELMPQFLFMINWADSAPGLSWPESYHVAYLPGYDRYVVTASQDSTDIWGYTELAIGSFDGNADVLAGARKVITDWWEEATRGSDDPRWAYVWEEGRVSRVEAESWADALWDDGYDVDAAVESIRCDAAGEEEIGEAVHTLLMACIERRPDSAGREKAEKAFASCLGPDTTPIRNLREIVQAAGQLGRDGRYLAPLLLALLDDPRLSDDGDIRIGVVEVFDDSKPSDRLVHDRLVALLTDVSEPDELRRACAWTLHTITGLEEYATILAMFPGRRRHRAAPHDSSLFRGGRNWYAPQPTKAMRRAAGRALEELTR
jgi:hypothetical protein